MIVADGYAGGALQATRQRAREQAEREGVNRSNSSLEKEKNFVKPNSKESEGGKIIMSPRCSLASGTVDSGD